MNHYLEKNKENKVKILQEGIDNKQFELYYQPQIQLLTGKVSGVEALIRWMHPEEGIIPPCEFIPFAEETGQIYEIDKWVVTTALEQKMKWENQGFHDLELSINLSGKTLEEENEFHNIEEIFENYQINYKKIIIEITETVPLRKFNYVIQRLYRMKKRGIKIALDDFGTGYSSITYLIKLPIDVIKLDRSCVISVPNSFVDTVVTRDLLGMARDLSYEVIAEGIETLEQLKFLKANLCNNGQGNLFSKPVSAKIINEIILQTNNKGEYVNA